MRIKGINELNQVCGFEVYQDQKQPREKKLTERSREPTFSTHKLPCTLVEDEFSKPLLKSVFIIFTYSSIFS